MVQNAGGMNNVERIGQKRRVLQIGLHKMYIFGFCRRVHISERLALFQSRAQIERNYLQPEFSVGNRLAAVSAACIKHHFPIQFFFRNAERVEKKPLYPVSQLHCPCLSADIVIVPFVAEISFCRRVKCFSRVLKTTTFN